MRESEGSHRWTCFHNFFRRDESLETVQWETDQWWSRESMETAKWETVQWGKHFDDWDGE